jgi:two-component system, OmpR family, response regulator MtrA
MARIVVADDDADIRELVTFKLTDAGHEVVAVPDGAAAIAACDRERADLLVLDLMMPGVTGLDVVDRLRTDAAYAEDYAEVPIILLTARASAEASALRTGASTYMSKPFSPRELAARVEELLHA